MVSLGGSARCLELCHSLALCLPCPSSLLATGPCRASGMGGKMQILIQCGSSPPVMAWVTPRPRGAVAEQGVTGYNSCSSKEISDLGYSRCSFSRRCLHHHFPVGINGASVDKVGSKQKLQLQTRQELLKLKKSRSKPIPPPHCLDGVKQHWGVKHSHPLFAIT